MFEAHKDPEGNVYVTFDGRRFDLYVFATEICSTLNWARDQQDQLRRKAKDIAAVMGKLGT